MPAQMHLYKPAIRVQFNIIGITSYQILPHSSNPVPLCILFFILSPIKEVSGSTFVATVAIAEIHIYH